MEESRFQLKVSDDGDDDVAYLALNFSDDMTVQRCIRLRNLIEDYKGPDLFLDFNPEGVLVGIEILA